MRRRALCLACLVCALAACERTRTGKGAPAGAATTSRNPNLPATAPRSAVSWNDTIAGPDLFVAGANPTEAVDVMPRFSDSTLSDAPTLDAVLAQHPHVDLFARAGHAGAATLSAQAEGNFSGSCTTWPTAHVTTPGGPPPEWSVAFTVGHATALPMDSVAALNTQDSAKRAAEVARVASALPNDTAAAFRGLPFALRDAHQFTLPSGDTVIAAEVVRRLNQEANPAEEHIFIVLERDTVPGPGGTPALYRASYSERTSGPEDDVETDEVLAGVLLGHGPRGLPTLILDRDYGDGNSYTLIQRTARRVWRARWSSAYVGC
jgi:hypothetical protein